MQVSIDLIPFICEAFSSNTALHKEIEKLYEWNKYKYYELAKSSKWYNHEFITSQSIVKEIVMKRVLALLIEGDEDKLLRLIRKGWPRLYNYAVNNEIISLDDYVLKTIPRDNKRFNEITNDELNAHFAIAVLLSELLGKEFKPDDRFYKQMLEFFYVRQEWAKGKFRYSLSNLSAEDRGKIRDFKKKIYIEGGISRHWLSHGTAALQVIRDLHDAYGFLFDTESLSSSIVEEMVLSEQDIEEILGTYYVVFKNRNTVDGAKYLAGAHIIKALLRAYKQLKEEHFRNNKETLYLDLDTAEQKAQAALQEVKRLQETIKARDTEIEALRRQVRNEYGRASQEFRQQIKAIENVNKYLQQEIGKLQKEKADLELALFTPVEDGPVECDIDLSGTKGVIVGGHNRWQQKIKEVLPASWKLIGVDENINLDLLLNVDYVFFNTNYLSHRVFYAVVNEARRRNISVGYIRKTNENECLAEIKRQILGRDNL